MTPVEKETLIKQLEWRYATKKFDASKKISLEDFAALERALVLSPSSFGLQPWKFLVISDPAVRAKLRPVSWDQSQIVDASHLVVFAAKHKLTVGDVERHLQNIAGLRNVPFESLDPYRQRIVKFITAPASEFNLESWTTRQVYIALGTLLTAAAMLGIDTCPMEGLEPKEYDRILGLKEKNLSTVVVCTLGYRADDDGYAKLKKVRFDAGDVIERV